ncbi:bacterial Ig-like domain-containing protein [Lactococcus raffinolactis]|uniref:bacterial Ig-like domain-containing protein n=1 Tax=Pseudolactococcus raffinolactis TaxID=1366 RepID=UPI00288D7FC2|nr:bacterial Ig-like domain-containing protein [Lactococcus raffinolactis]MDT2766479.1 bacterial Ig-like domain-containing protein [Lactococcus raffinolactis]MDT2789574.1 bacterial Ig-like domain-containing protein [Lactococcus raffinolactis]
MKKKDFSNGSWKKVNIDYTPNALGTGTIRYDYIDLGNGIKRNASLTFNYDGKGKVPAFKGTSEVFWGFTSATGELWAENAIAFDALPVQGKVEAKDSSIYVGQKWSPSYNFVSGKDTFGKPLDVKDLRIYVDGKLNGTLDTSKPGVHKVKYEYVVKTNGLPDQIFDKEVTVTVLQTTQVKSKPQVLRYIDNDSSKFNAKDFVTVADDKGKPLSNYTARFLSFPNSLNGKEAVVEVTDTHGQVFTVKVPVTYKLGNTINLLGRSDDRVATFSLDDAGKNIVATYNYASGNTKIHRDFSDTYYSFSHFWQKTLNSGSLNTQNPDYIFSAKGTDLLNTLDQFDGDRILGVSPGDVIKINHKEGGHLLQNYVNNASEGDSPAKEMLYEITTKGFKTLALNRLIPVDSVVLQGASKADLDKNLSTYLPVNGNVKMVGFKTYPDVNKRGNSTGVITVKEELSIGKSVTWDYAVKFNVQRKFDSVTAKKQVLKYTDNKNDYDPRKFVEVKDISGKVTNDYHATFTSFPNSLDGKEAIVEVTPKNDTIGEKYTVKVPVTYELGNSINLLGYNDDRVATFSLNDGATKVTATYNHAKGKTAIHRSFSDTYYSFEHFWQKTITSGALKTQIPDYAFSAKGIELLSKLDRFGGYRSLDVSSGDVIKIKHKEPGRRFQNYMNSVSQGATSRNEVYFEIARDGYRELNLNKLSSKVVKVKWQATTVEMDEVLQQLVDISTYPNLKIVGYTQYPDTSKTGKQAGKIKVEETLISGKKASYTYDITLDVQPFDNTDPDSHDPKDPNMWLNVEVPLEMDFHSTENSKHQKIEGSVGKVKNHSGRPVQVTVKGFTNASGGKADTLGIDSLVLKGDVLSTPIDLKHFSATPQHLIDLQSPAKSGQNVTLSGVSEVNLSISGTAVSNLKAQHHSTNKFELLFTPLDKDGNPNL